MNSHSTFTRRLTTSAQVHPKILPYMHNHGPLFRGPALKRLPAYAAAACVGYAVATYQYSQTEKPLNVQQQQQESHLTEDLLEAYGGRESLAELERAANVYSQRR